MVGAAVGDGGGVGATRCGRRTVVAGGRGRPTRRTAEEEAVRAGEGVGEQRGGLGQARESVTPQPAQSAAQSVVDALPGRLVAVVAQSDALAPNIAHRALPVVAPRQRARRLRRRLRRGLLYVHGGRLHSRPGKDERRDGQLQRPHPTEAGAVVRLPEKSQRRRDRDGVARPGDVRGSGRQ